MSGLREAPETEGSWDIGAPLPQGLGLAVLQGIFATHLHSLLDMQLDARRLVRMRMETAEDGRFIRATMRMLPGQCTE
jgi:hypothetical protein